MHWRDSTATAPAPSRRLLAPDPARTYDKPPVFSLLPDARRQDSDSETADYSRTPRDTTDEHTSPSVDTPARRRRHSTRQRVCYGCRFDRYRIVRFGWSNNPNRPGPDSG